MEALVSVTPAQWEVDMGGRVIRACWLSVSFPDLSNGNPFQCLRQREYYTDWSFLPGNTGHYSFVISDNIY